LGLSIAWMKFSGPNESGKISDVLFQELKCTRDMMCWNGTGDPEPEDADIVYVTRPQVERHAEERPPISESARINLAFAVRLPEHAIIMHPLPRTGELSPEVDKDERAWYFKQVENGLHVRMALLEMLLVKN
jgi:aspartate carbamoyltransferase catalytic subunit